MNEQIAFDIACGARILASEGLSTLVAGHLSFDVGGEMYVNRFGPSFGQVRPEDIIRVDYEGNVVEGEGHTNDTIKLHGVLHRMVPERRALVHTHPPSVVTLGSFRIVPEIYDQESCFMAGDVSIFDETYEGLVTVEDRISPMAGVLKKASNLILPNHGALTSGDSIPVATIRMALLEHTAKRHIAVQQTAATMGLKPQPIADKVAIQTRKELEALNVEKLLWKDYVNRLKLGKSGGFD